MRFKVFCLLGDILLGQNLFSKGLQVSLLFLHRKIKPHQHSLLQERLDHSNIVNQGDGELNSHDYFLRVVSNAKQSWKVLRHPETLLQSLNIENKIQWEQLLSSNQPQIFWGVHMGPFEWLHQILSTTPSQRTIHLITLESPISLISKLRNASSSKIKIWRHTDLGQATRKALRHGDIIAILLDQGPQEMSSKSTIFNHQWNLFIHQLPRWKSMGFELVYFNISRSTAISSNLNKYILTHSLMDLNQKETSIESQAKVIAKAELEIENSIQNSPIDFIWHYPWHLL